MKNLSLFLKVFLIIITVKTFSQNNTLSEGYVIYGENMIPRTIMNLNNSNYSGTPKEIAFQYIADNLEWITNGENGELTFIKETHNACGSHIAFKQKINGIPVIGSESVININSENIITFVFNGYKSGINISTEPLISLDDAIIIARNSFTDPSFALKVPTKSQLSIYIDNNGLSYLVWRLIIIPEEGGEWYVLADALSSTIIKMENIIVAYEDGNGTVWNPDAGTFLEDISLPDNNDEDYIELQAAYTDVVLHGLLDPVDDLFYLRGEFAYSSHHNPPEVYAYQSTPNFFYHRDDYGFEETNCYFHLDKVIRYVRSLGFYPEWNNATVLNSSDILFDATDAGGLLNTGYSPTLEIVYFAIFLNDKDAAEDQSVIIHELGHAFHDSFLIGGLDDYVTDKIPRSISEGFSDYLGIDYRRQTSMFRPNAFNNWWIPNLRISINDDYNFVDNWSIMANYNENGITWASSLMDLEYTVATDPSNGLRLGRDVVTSNQLAAFTYITGEATTEENVLAMYQADLDIYNGEHLREYIDVYHNRLLFDDQNIFNNITQNTIWEGFKKINNVIHVESGNTLVIEPYSVIVMDGEFIIDAGANLEIGNNVLFIGYDPEHKLNIYGNLDVGADVSFISNTESWSVFLNNYNLNTELNNINFNRCELHNFGQSLSITNSTFQDYYRLISHRGIVDISYCDFSSNSTQSWLYIENTDENNNLVSISNCNFTTTVVTMVAIDIWNYNHFDISNNTIDKFYNGIQIMQSGYGKPKNQMIKDNTITNCSQNGIVAFSTRSDIYRNHITNNGCGVWFGDQSSIRLYGSSGAVSWPQTQEIMDNDWCEVYASEYSFPIYFRYNVIIDEDNLGEPSDPMVYHGGHPSALKDVKYNCWGSNFDPEEDFFPTGYIWEPTWCPTFGGGSSSGADEDLYEVANNLFDTEDYSGAKSMYEMLIDQYPDTKFAKAAMQELYALEQYASNDYNSLKQYYEINSTIQSQPDLTQTGEYMVSKCDIKLGNYYEAISYYEGIILNPETMEDSIFAIIDLGYVYFVMDNSGYKSTYTGNLLQYKPESKEQFFENRNYLLSLIPGDQMSGTMKENIARLKKGELLQNVPNPFKGSTQIWYKLENESKIQLKVYNYTGQLIRTIDEGNKTGGNHFVEFDATSLKNGIYIYSISINGRITDSKKMTIIN